MSGLFKGREQTGNPLFKPKSLATQSYDTKVEPRQWLEMGAVNDHALGMTVIGMIYGFVDCSVF